MFEADDEILELRRQLAVLEAQADELRARLNQRILDKMREAGFLDRRRHEQRRAGRRRWDDK